MTDFYSQGLKFLKAVAVVELSIQRSVLDPTFVSCVLFN